MKHEPIQSTLLRYLYGLVLLALAIGIRALLHPWLGSILVYPTVYIAGLLTCWYFGLGPAILHVFLGYLAVENLFVQTPPSEMTPSNIIAKFTVYSALNAVLLGFAVRLRIKQDELLKTRNSLAEREELLRSVCYGAVDSIIVTDRRGKILLVNPSASQLLGKPIEELIGKNYHEITDSEETRTFTRVSDSQILESGATHTFDIVLPTAHGARSFIVSKTPQLNRGGEIVGIISIFRDITERKNIYDTLHQSQKMEALGQLSGGIAHDFNNLLTLILGYTERLKAGLHGEKALEEKADFVLQAALRARDLTSQLLAFSRRQIVEPQTFSLNTTINGGREMIRRLIGEHVNLETVLDPALWPVHADPGQLLQAVINLAVNARDAMPDGGDIVIETHNEVLDSGSAKRGIDLKPGDYAVLAVRDTGTGMDAETQKKIFEPFFTTKGPGKGTGLGLSMVYGASRDAGGTVVVESSPGKGSLFKIYLPRSLSEVKQDHFKIAEPDGSGTETILLVEDEPSLREMAAEVLREKGYTVIDAGSAKEALEKAGRFEGKIDLLLTDVIMPGMHGRNLAEKIKQARDQIKVLYMSGYTDDEIVRRGVMSHGIAFVPKPFTHAKLLAQVRAVLDDGKTDAAPVV